MLNLKESVFEPLYIYIYRSLYKAKLPEIDLEYVDLEYVKTICIKIIYQFTASLLFDLVAHKQMIKYVPQLYIYSHVCLAL